MIELVNLSNGSFDDKGLLGNRAEVLSRFLARHSLAGIEFMPCCPWNQQLHPAGYIKGVHLMFWPNWVSFWRGDKVKLQTEFGSMARFQDYYGAATVEGWLQAWQQNLRRAVACQPEYVVFHVSDALSSELYTREFATSADQVIEAAIELVNVVMKDLPDRCQLLFENLWWPGLTFQWPELAERLLNGVEHTNTGFMLDTGHLMNTNLDLHYEDEGADYVLKIYRNLGELGRYVRGMHLHCSFSGDYTRHMQEIHAGDHHPLNLQESMEYVMQVDWHHPFQTEAVRRIVDEVQPDYLVHEFIQSSYDDWEQKLHTQRHALGWE